MKRINPLSLLGTLLTFIGTLGLASSACIGWFYKPQVPDVLLKK
ncbi:MULTISPECIES: cyclic lactone autoinducer peptide [Thermoanaerobacter]|jgi:cyclic lactone autoinducer peptide|uniref:Cyclic lactone autoinducer peptide n=1 Tax=Thermoanaerobacter uzonensis DSM 18761 TaxID=1123369 RepID=A0A1M4TY63_9THEO|nr:MULTISPECIES: cyclic lactone autoinducer peptide [Thermoanaerobacter]KHO61086.1 cyclic lactone autoinducer peptide [Thermoanaerobacter sp. YS13]SHE49314.1 cyclic lactone autoinducer peptide [Thermoanaerobacter uzonensis DSM 18761]